MVSVLCIFCSFLVKVKPILISQEMFFFYKSGINVYRWMNVCSY